MDCVAALSLLRMVNFSIPLQSRFALKGIAGNIVHAISTTNAISAGLMVNLAIKVISKADIENTTLNGVKENGETKEHHSEKNQSSETLRLCYESLAKPEILKILHTTWINRHAPYLLRPQPLDLPSKMCVACSQRPLLLKINTNTFTLRSLYEKVAKKTLSMNEPSIDVTSHDNFLDTIEEHEADYLSLACSDTRVRAGHGAMLSITDQAQQLTAHLMIVHVPEEEGENKPTAEDQHFVLEGEVEKTEQNEQMETEPSSQAVKEVIDSTDDIELIDPSAPKLAPAVAPSSRKRKHDREEETEQTNSSSQKRSKLEEENSSKDDPIELD
jgi:ubiquitin-like 1-activating enzyme E1 B